MIFDLLGRPSVLHLTSGHHADVRAAPDNIAKAGRSRRPIADRTDDGD